MAKTTRRPLPWSYDSRKRKIVGSGGAEDVSTHNFAAHWTTEPQPRRLSLKADDLDETRAELERKRTERRDYKLPPRGYWPTCGEFAREYLNCDEFAEKSVGTRKLEGWVVSCQVEHLRGVRVDRITPAHVYNYREKRLRLGRVARTVNLDTIA